MTTVTKVTINLVDTQEEPADEIVRNIQETIHIFNELLNKARTEGISLDINMNYGEEESDEDTPLLEDCRLQFLGAKKAILKHYVPK